MFVKTKHKNVLYLQMHSFFTAIMSDLKTEKSKSYISYEK